MSTTTSMKYGRRYPWDKWFNRKKPFKLTKGIDFNGRADTMAVLIRRTSKAYNVRVAVTINEEGTTITVRIVGER